MLRPRSLSLFALTLALALTACDGSEPDTTCEELDLLSTGTVTASTSEGPFRATCYQVTRNSIGGFAIAAVEFGSDPSVEFVRGSLVVGTQLPDPGAYAIGAEDMEGSAEYTPPDDRTGTEAVSGSIILTDVTSDRVRGTFSFVTEDGVSVSNGRFDVAY